MANEIKLTLKVNDDGSLDLVAKKAKEAGAATEKLEKATKKTNKTRGNYNKVEKGVGQMTSNTTKAFSKQTGVISGGLVPAYAVLAANIFAITAAIFVQSLVSALRTLVIKDTNLFWILYLPSISCILFSLAIIISNLTLSGFFIRKKN